MTQLGQIDFDVLRASMRRGEIWMGLRLEYRVAQMCNADSRDNRRVAKYGWRACKVVKESNSRAK